MFPGAAEPAAGAGGKQAVDRDRKAADGQEGPGWSGWQHSSDAAKMTGADVTLLEGPASLVGRSSVIKHMHIERGARRLLTCQIDHGVLPHALVASMLLCHAIADELPAEAPEQDPPETAAGESSAEEEDAEAEAAAPEAEPEETEEELMAR